MSDRDFDNSGRTIKYLDRINSPEDVKKLSAAEAAELAEEIRGELVRVTSKNGGHLASNLGVVELTLGIHRVFDAPDDHIIFDVGHQSYVHKMLTGRYERIDTLRQSGGLCGFTKRSESEYDCFGAGHSSTSISAALGFAISDKLSGSDAYTVAVVGDGAFTGGMIHEALNNCRKDLNMIIVMNENEMSISKNIGRFAANLAKLRNTSGYFKTKKATGDFLKKIPFVGKYLFRFLLAVKKSLKNLLYGSNYFESMGLTYLGPIDGNDITAVENLLREAKKLGESVLVHIKTKKGKGYAPAESSPEYYHGMKPEDCAKNDGRSFSSVMGEELCALAERDSRICAITAAMCDGTGLSEFRGRYGERFFDVGIAEEHALTFSAGLAANGYKPVTAIYSTFLQRGYDNILHDIALQDLPCIICIDRAGLNGGDGATHHGIFDVAFLSHIPNIRIYTPATYGALSAAVRDAYARQAPCAIRYPSGCECESVVSAFYPTGEYQVPSAVRDFGENDAPDVVLIAHGRIASDALAAKAELFASGISLGIILLEVIKPYGECAEKVRQLLPKGVKRIVFLEEEIRNGGMGACLADTMFRAGMLDGTDYRIIATDDSFVDRVEKGQSIYEAAGVDCASIVKTVKEFI